MKILIVYASKYGATKKLAEELQRRLKNCEIKSIHDHHENMEAYDILLCGSSVYIGRIDKTMKAFLEQVTHPAIYFYMSGLNREDCQKVVCENFSEQTQAKLKGSICLGGALNFRKMNFLEKTSIKLINKKAHLFEKIESKECYDLYDQQAIDDFIKLIETKR